MKTCSGPCGLRKEESDFGKRNSGSYDGLQKQCKQCQSEQGKVRYNLNKDAVIKRTNTHAKENRTRYNSYSQKSQFNSRNKLSEKYVIERIHITEGVPKEYIDSVMIDVKRALIIESRK